MQDQRKWAPEDLALLMRMAVEGWPVETIAEKLSRECSEVRARARRAGLTLKPPPSSPFVGDGMAALAEAERWRKMTNDTDVAATQGLERRSSARRSRGVH